MIWQDPSRVANDSDAILAELSTRQYLAPHTTLATVLNDAQQKLGFCPAAGQTAVHWLQLDPGQAIGRLRRSELIQLAKSIYRFWQRSFGAEPAHSQPG